ncbi:MAG: LysR family transcriptional regulator [Janthinobacterium lividum]
MNPIQISDLDLRLLRVLDTLLETSEVSRASEILGVSPSAVSHSLRLLRAKFGDPLLVRSRGRLQPTALALALRVSLRAGLNQLAEVMAKEASFDPARSTRVMSLATPDYPLVLMMPPVIADVRRAAPGVDLRLRSIGPDVFDALADGRLDLVLAGAEVETNLALDREVMRSCIISEPFRCVMRADHPAARTRSLDREAYLEACHILVSTTGGDRGIVDDVLDRSGLRRRVAVTVPSFMAASAYAASSALIATLPETIAQHAAAQAGVVVREPPFDLPRSTAYIWWHPRFQNDPGHAWWRRTLLDSFAPYRRP